MTIPLIVTGIKKYQKAQNVNTERIVMGLSIKNDQWVWVIIQNPGENETLVGQFDEEFDISFIPVFLDKEAAQDGFLQIPKQKNQKHEIQAILMEDLIEYSKNHGFMLFILDSDGKILNKIDPGDQ